MAVSVRGKVYKLRVRPGPEGKEDFKRQIRSLLGFSADMDFDVIFECKTPHNGEAGDDTQHAVSAASSVPSRPPTSPLNTHTHTRVHTCGGSGAAHTMRSATGCSGWLALNGRSSWWSPESGTW